MTNLERRALLGDRQAQDECTRRGIVLPCPCCGCDERDMLGMSVYHDQYFYCCESCGCNGPIVYVNDNCDYPGHEALVLWNTRPAPPIGRCEECDLWYEEKGICTAGSDDDLGTYEYTEPDHFCGYFKQKDGEEK